jgi:putative transposase
VRKERFSDGAYYHIFNRGVEKRNIFTMRDDYKRFLFDLTVCNDERPLDNAALFHRGILKPAAFVKRVQTRKPYVSILCFCLMPNHFHLLLKQIGDDGVPRFMQKLSVAYSMYFNTKHERVGPLFQGRYKAVHIKDEAYLTHLSRYIHINPLDLEYPNWKKKGIKSPLKAQQFLQSYSWSSYRDYLGYNAYPDILDRDLLPELLGKPKELKNFTQEWVELRGLQEVFPFALFNESRSR